MSVLDFRKIFVRAEIANFELVKASHFAVLSVLTCMYIFSLILAEITINESRQTLQKQPKENGM